MKILNAFISAALLVIGAGCQSREPETVSQSSMAPAQNVEQNAPMPVARQEPNGTTIQQVTTDKVTYTIQTIPNPRLSPTSREGDKANQVYSSNIIAVYVHTNNDVSVSSTNATLIPTPTSNPQP